MTTLLQKALRKVAKLSNAEQDEIAVDILARLERDAVSTEGLQIFPFPHTIILL